MRAGGVIYRLRQFTISVFLVGLTCHPHRISLTVVPHYARRKANEGVYDWKVLETFHHKPLTIMFGHRNKLTIKKDNFMHTRLH